MVRYLQVSVDGDGGIVAMVQRLDDLQQLLEKLREYGIDVEVEGISRCG